MAASANLPCPCGSGTKYKRCCRPLHKGQAPSSPEALMRSRYSGYCLGLVDYIIQTTAAEAADARGDRARWRQEIEGFCRTTQFRALEVVAASETEDSGTVTFIARLQQGARDVSFRERSTFVRTADRWFYLSGKSEPI